MGWTPISKLNIYQNKAKQRNFQKYSTVSIIQVSKFIIIKINVCQHQVSSH